MPKLPVGVCLIVRDEVHHIRRCLSSVADLVSEIIVVDTGSKDGTLDVVREFPAKIVHTEWQCDFADARNIALTHATEPWILSIDADEELDDANADYISKLINSPNVCGYFVKIRNYLDSAEDAEFITDSACRLFRNQWNIRFTGAIHESVIPAIEDISGQIEFSDVTFNHYGYSPETIANKDKNTRNMRIIENAIQHNPEDLTMQYALATEYFQQAKYEACLTILYPLLTKVPVSTGYASDIVVKTAYALRALGRLDEAKRMLDNGRTFFPDFPDLLDLGANIEIEKGDYKAAENLLTQSTQLGDMSHKYTSASGAGTYQSHLLMGITQELLGCYDCAQEHYRDGLNHSPDSVLLWKRYALLTLGMEWNDTFVSCLKQHASILPDRVWKVIFQALIDHRHPSLVRKAIAYYPSSLFDPLLNAVVHAQEGHFKVSRKEFTSLLDNPIYHNMASDYLWALNVRNCQNEEEYCTRMTSLLDHAVDTRAACTNLDVDRPTLLPQRHQSIQRALLQLGAVDGWLVFQRTFTPAKTAWLPLHAPLAWMNIPRQIREKLVELADAHRATLSHLECLILGFLCLEGQLPRQALSWFQSRSATSLPDVAVTSGTYASYVELAGEHWPTMTQGDCHLRLNTRGLLLHLLSYM